MSDIDWDTLRERIDAYLRQDVPARPLARVYLQNGFALFKQLEDALNAYNGQVLVDPSGLDDE